MKYLIVAALSLTIASPALAVTAEQVTSCQQQYRAKNKADDAAAPSGYRVKRERNAFATYMAGCLSKSDTAAK